MGYKPLTREELLKRGKCCHHGCKNCPYKKCKHKNTYKVEKYEETQIWCSDCKNLTYSEDNLK